MMFIIICSFVLVFLLVGVAYYNMKSTLEASTTTVDAVNMITRREDSTAQSTPATPATPATQAKKASEPTEASEDNKANDESKPSKPSKPSEASKASDASVMGQVPFPVKKVSVDAVAINTNNNRIDVKHLFDWGFDDEPIVERGVTKTQTYVVDGTGVIEGKTADVSNRVVASWSQSVDTEFNSPDCVSKDPSDAWAADLYGFCPPAKEASHNASYGVMQKTQQYQNLIKEMTTANQYRSGLQADDLLATTSMSVEDYDPSGGI